MDTIKKQSAFFDYLRDTELKSRINVIIINAETDFLRDLGKNGFPHSTSIENYLNRLVPEPILKKIDKAEIFVLLCAVYLHDIGRKFITNPKGDGHEQATYNEILENYHRYHLQDEYEAKAIAEVCFGHASEEEKPITSIDRNFGVDGLNSKPLDLQFLSALLRLADELDNSYIRVRGVNYTKRDRKLIRHVDIKPNRWKIEIQCEPKTWNDLIELIELKRKVQTRLNEVQDILERKELFYRSVTLDTSMESVAEEIKTKLRAKLKSNLKNFQTAPIEGWSGPTNEEINNDTNSKWIGTYYLQFLYYLEKIGIHFEVLVSVCKEYDLVGIELHMEGESKQSFENLYRKNEDYILKNIGNNIKFRDNFRGLGEWEKVQFFEDAHIYENIADKLTKYIEFLKPIIDEQFIKK